MTDLPQYVEPVVGFRAWRLAPDGELGPWSMVREPWRPGVNEARCLAVGADAHAVPGHDCTCGLYALAQLDDERLDPEAAAVGSIAAWGEMEVHATGFRARFATITGLAVAARASEAHRALLARAASRYGVELVEHAGLSQHALAFGQPVSFEAIPRIRAAAPSTGPSLDEHGLRGIALDDHVWVEIAAGGVLVLGITAAMATAIEICSPVRAAEIGRDRPAGEALATIGDRDGALLVRAPCELSVFEINPRLATDPDLVRTDAEGEGWLLRAFPRSWEREAGRIVWGRRARTLYRASVAHAARIEDPFGWQKPAWVARQPRARNAAEALAILAAQRSAPRFADARAVREHIGGRIDRALADPGVRASASRARVRLALRLHHPDAELAVDLDGGALGPGPSASALDRGGPITLDADAEIADLFLAGRLDIASALRSQRIRTDASHTRVLVVASLIKELQRAYRAQG
jgi:glycine cleavage system H lipoate-binding protein